MTPYQWLRLLWQNQFRVDWRRLHVATGISVCVPFNAVMNGVQTLIYGRAIRNAQVVPPLFIVGHWRSGTTLLHELFTLDDRFACPNTYQCFAPRHFLVTEWFFTRYANFLLPRQRPMDNMPAGWQRPQEDEFALLIMGLPTPYRSMAFPNRRPVHLEMLDLAGVPDRVLQRWDECFVRFLKTLSLRYGGKRLVLKSPPHTGRIGHLAELLPGARFVHIARNPEEIFASTCHLWRQLDRIQGLQVPGEEDLEEYVLTCLERMYRGYRRGREEVPEGSLCEVRYEELIRDPVGTMEAIYQKLELGAFDRIKQRLEAARPEIQRYRPNRFQLSTFQRLRIWRRWAWYFHAFGYALAPASAEQAAG